MDNDIVNPSKIYLDNCCFNRPYDDQTKLKIELETKAKLYIQNLIIQKEFVLVISYIFEMENNVNPFIFRKTAISDFFNRAEVNVVENDEIIQIANSIMKDGLKTKDALHLACAIFAKCDFFITTDDRLLKHKNKDIEILNPIYFITR